MNVACDATALVLRFFRPRPEPGHGQNLTSEALRAPARAREPSTEAQTSYQHRPKGVVNSFSTMVKLDPVQRLQWRIPCERLSQRRITYIILLTVTRVHRHGFHIIVRKPQPRHAKHQDMTGAQRLGARRIGRQSRPFRSQGSSERASEPEPAPEPRRGCAQSAREFRICQPTSSPHPDREDTSFWVARCFHPLVLQHQDRRLAASNRMPPGAAGCPDIMMTRSTGLPSCPPSGFLHTSSRIGLDRILD